LPRLCSPTSQRRSYVDVDGGAHSEKLPMLEILQQVRAAEPYSMNFSNITYRSRVGNETVTILDNISGVTHPGDYMGILGPSGSGKTTLLNILAGRQKGFEGKLDPDPQDPGHGAHFSMFVREASSSEHVAFLGADDDALYPTMTVREVLEFSAFVRLPSGVPKSVMEHLVDHVLELLHLHEVADHGVGAFRDSRKGGGEEALTLGERRRVLIGTEVVAGKTSFFIDEPAGGLSREDEAIFVKALKLLTSEAEYTAISVLRQPRMRIFAALDTLLLLSAKGSPIFFGPSHEVTIL
jgi:ABC-type multidrug transport system ATPase subunit